MAFSTPDDPRASMRGRTFYGAVATVLLTRGAGMSGAAWAPWEGRAQDFLEDPNATGEAKGALWRVLADMPYVPNPTGGPGTVTGVWARHYDGPGGVAAALDALADAGIWFWYVVVLDDVVEPQACVPAGGHFHPGVGVCQR